jgi:hypothetical protein
LKLARLRLVAMTRFVNKLSSNKAAMVNVATFENISGGQMLKMALKRKFLEFAENGFSLNDA